MPKSERGVETVYPRDRSEWRRWLQDNHATNTGAWLIYDKKGSGKQNLTYDEAVEEALCFGWIDSRPNTLDDERWMQLFSPRKRKSPWSRLNKQRVEKLIEQGLMAPAGLEKIETAKQDGSWSLLDAIEELKLPPDLEKALAANDTAHQYFMAFSPSSKKGIFWWIESAKRPETRAKRIQETVTLAAQNIKANYPRQ
jgi:uncharacterized protein YdeI (YjbR/CyaY-like superfamily)